jgi:hypothetical protein
MVFVTFEGKASYTVRRHRRVSKVMVSHEKICKSSLRLRKERRKNLVERGKLLKKIWIRVDF